MTFWSGPEGPWLWAGLTAYGLAAALAPAAVSGDRRARPWVLALLGTGVGAYGVLIALRWYRAGQGPFLTMFEILVSNLFSLGLILAAVCWRSPAARPAALFAAPVLALLGVWALVVPAGIVPLPPTYDNNWLWVHVAMGKVFLGVLLVAAGLSVALLCRRAGRLRGLPEEAAIAVWKYAAVAFVFESLMLVAGAIWAQDAWGRYWDWDPLESWAFATWLALAATLHARLTLRWPDWSFQTMIVGVFALAFLTFFGVPFLSIAPHKGAV